MSEAQRVRTQTLIVYLYSDGCIEVDPFFRERIGNAVTIDELINDGWRFLHVSGNWFKAINREDVVWFGALMEKEITGSETPA
jgi:hypothetical protein